MARFGQNFKNKTHLKKMRKTLQQSFHDFQAILAFFQSKLFFDVKNGFSDSLTHSKSKTVYFYERLQFMKWVQVSPNGSKLSVCFKINKNVLKFAKLRQMWRKIRVDIDLPNLELRGYCTPGPYF